MNILVANDDGIDAVGLHRLVDALAELGTVYVAAPNRQRSASGHSITIGGPIHILEVNMDEFPNAEMVLSTTGTPADCVKLGLKHLEKMGIEIDLVCSGINHGGNLGTDTLYSGTVAAAIEGALCGKGAIAVSVNSHDPSNFDYPCKLAVAMAPHMAKAENKGIALSINTPDLPSEEIKGVKYTRLGVRGYQEWFDPIENEDGSTEYWYQGAPVVYNSKNTDIDVIADQEGYASITPLQCNLTNNPMIDVIREWEKDI